MNTPRKRYWVRVLLGGVALWFVVLAGYAVYTFLVPHGPYFAPEVGPTGAFVIFAILFSLYYTLLFFFLVLPICHFLSASFTTRRLRSGGRTTKTALAVVYEDEDKMKIALKFVH